jgi:hypothetical protein
VSSSRPPGGVVRVIARPLGVHDRQNVVDVAAGPHTGIPTSGGREGRRTRTPHQALGSATQTPRPLGCRASGPWLVFSVTNQSRNGARRHLVLDQGRRAHLHLRKTGWAVVLCLRPSLGPSCPGGAVDLSEASRSNWPGFRSDTTSATTSVRAGCFACRSGRVAARRDERAVEPKAPCGAENAFDHGFGVPRSAFSSTRRLPRPPTRPPPVRERAGSGPGGVISGDRVRRWVQAAPEGPLI